MPEFNLEEKDWFVPQLVAENDFINSKNSDADLAKFGKTYSVKFGGDAGTYMWTTKTEPEVGKKYYGHLQKTSGTSIRFKTDKEPEGQAPKEAISNFESVDKQSSVNRAVALKAAAVVSPMLKINIAEDVLMIADVFYTWLKNESNEAPKATEEVRDEVVDKIFPRDEEDYNE